MDKALGHAQKGFFVFPVYPNSKIPRYKEWNKDATRDPKRIESWWNEKAYNIGIFTGRFQDSQSLVVVDIDKKKGRDGFKEALRLELQGKEFPRTLTQKTPSGGKHLIYLSDKPVPPSQGKLGEGIDIRSASSYIVAEGSKFEGAPYIMEEAEIAPCPDWIIEACGTSDLTPANKEIIETNENLSRERAIDFLKNKARIAIEGQGGQFLTVMVARDLRDIGIDAGTALELMLEYWNPRCLPPWSHDELEYKINESYKGAKLPQGTDSPEAHFTSVSNPTPSESIETRVGPVEALNKEFLYLSKNSEVLWETVDSKNEAALMYLSISAFHNHLLSKGFIDGNGKYRQTSQEWMRSPKRRSFVDTCFRPGTAPPPQFYNLWKGFSVESHKPGEIVPAEAKRSLEDLLNHVKENICEGKEELFDWYMGYFAHMIQKPHKKPLTAIVMKGEKGTGKNVVIDCVGHLVKNNSVVVSNKRYLTSNFNAHLESLLLFTLDEAFWSGDKQSEGILKDLITGKTHFIERKGQEAYQVDNLTRVVIIGNEDWVVPATQDERRFAVFNVGSARKQDTSFFQSIMDGMEKGGYRLLFDYLKNKDISNLKINVAPATEGLLEQKTASLDPFHQWWVEILDSGQLPGAHEDPWPQKIDCDLFRDHYHRYLRDRNIRSRSHPDNIVGKMVRKVCPTSQRFRARLSGGSGRVWRYWFPDLTTARQEWEQFIGHKIKWHDVSDT